MKSVRQLRRSQRNVRRSRSLGSCEEVNILPLIDVLFLLLAFFMVLSTSLVLQKGMRVDLAQAESGETTVAEEEMLTVSINEHAELFFDKTPTTTASLAGLLQSRFEKAPQTLVVVNADKKSTHQRVMEVLDTIRQSGFTNVTMTVVPTTK